MLLAGLLATPVLAQQTPYQDVPAGAYYEDAAAHLLEIGALDPATYLRPSELAVRAEMVKLLVNLNDNELLYPSVSSFNDVSRTAWYFPYFETAASAGWIHGDRNCVTSRLRPCTARPADGVNRAEAAAILVRAFALERTGTAPAFSDNSTSQWYYDIIQTAADHCVLQGDSGTGRVRPGALMNRAEMVVMFNRAYAHQMYGEDCGTVTASISSVVATGSHTVRIVFSSDLDEARAEMMSRYEVRQVGGAGAAVGVSSAVTVGARTVELQLSSDLQASTTYMLTTTDLRTIGGLLFSDRMNFTTSASVTGHITSAVALSATQVRAWFDVDLNEAKAENKANYGLERLTDGSSIAVNAATLVSSRVVDLTVGTLINNSNYRLTANGLQAVSGNSVFSANSNFTYQVSATGGHLIDAFALNATKIRFVFDVDLDRNRAEDYTNYLIFDGTRYLSVQNAALQNNRTVEVSLGESLRSQQGYTATANNQLTTQGVPLSGNRTFVYDQSTVFFNATITGAQEVPFVSTIATGTGTFNLTAAGLQYNITLKNMTGSITGAHFHQGAAGVNGAVLLPITFSGNTASGLWSAITSEQRNLLHSGQIYVNVHTAAYPNGYIRGQVVSQ